MEQSERERLAAKRDEALRMVRSGRAVNRVSRDLGISPVTLKNWMSEAERELHEPAKRGNPDTAPHDCPECGRPTKVSLRTGRLFSHNYPHQTKVCPGSGSEVLPSQPKRGKPPTLPPLRPPPEPKPRTPRYYDGPSQSIPARPSGLPGLGKRR
ncbi:transposase [Micromonospora chersina]